MSDVELVVKIPKKEFGIEIDDKFQDFFKRLKAEIKERLMSGTALVCGAYELETIEMLLNAFANATPLPKGHGDLIDVNRKITVPVYDEQYEEWGGKILTVREALNRWSDEGITVKDIVILADKAESVEGKE